MKKLAVVLAAALALSGCGADESNEKRDNMLNVLEQVWDETPTVEKIDICNTMDTMYADEWVDDYISYLPPSKQNVLTHEEILNHYRSSCKEFRGE